MVNKEFKALSRVGIDKDSVKKIRRFSLRREGNTDVVKIYFKTNTNDFFTYSKKFHFKRTSKRVLVDGGRQIYEDVYEISPFVSELVDELEALKADSEIFSTGKQLILEILDHLEKVMQNKIQEIKEEINKLSAK